MQLTLVDFNAAAFYPFSETRAISDILTVGGSIAHLWSKLLPQAKLSFCCADALSELYPKPSGECSLYVDSSVVPSKTFAEEVLSLPLGSAITHANGKVLAIHSKDATAIQWSKANALLDQNLQNLNTKDLGLVLLESANDLFLKLGECFQQFDTTKLELYTGQKEGVIVSGNELYVHPNARIQPGYYDTSSGPIILDENAEVSFGAMIKGPVYIGKHAIVKMGAKIYGPTSIGDHCRVGGEVSNCNIGAYSNKGHDGFIGNAVIGEWCNLGADTNCSNLKNNYSKVKQYHHGTGSIEQTNMQFCGVLMGDHSKTAINTQINTASVFGAFANAVCSTFPPKHLPNFSWYTDKGLSKFELDKAYEMADAMMARRNVRLTEQTKALWRFLAQ